MDDNNNPDGGQHQMGGTAAATGTSQQDISRAYTVITEQPASSKVRFRYECEGRSAGSIPGIRSTSENKTYPSISVCDFSGSYICVVSCVTKDKPYKPHPDNLVGRECKHGVCTVKRKNGNMSITFDNLGIQCVRKKDIEEALKKRELMRVDPFQTGFSHRNQPIILNAIRLCFQVFVKCPTGYKALKPVVSEPIFDKKAMSELVITKLSHCSVPVTGGKEVILLCEKVVKDDIAVRFYEVQDGQVVWEAEGNFQQNNVHKNVAIAFTVPPYRLLKINHMTPVFLQLKRPSDGAKSDPVRFYYLPVETEQLPKRKKIEDRKSLFQFVHDRAKQQQQHQMDYRETAQPSNVSGGFSCNIFNPSQQEPTDHPSPILHMQQQRGPSSWQRQQQQQRNINEFYGNPIPQALPQTRATPGNQSQNTFQPIQQQHEPQTVCPVTEYNHNVTQQQQQGNMQLAMDDLSSSTTTSQITFQRTPPPNIINGGGQQQTVTSDFVTLNIMNYPFSEVLPQLTGSEVLNGIGQDQENLTDPLLRLGSEMSN